MAPLIYQRVHVYNIAVVLNLLGIRRIRGLISTPDIKKDLKTMSFLLYYSKIAFLGQFLNFAKETQTS